MFREQVVRSIFLCLIVAALFSMALPPSAQANNASQYAGSFANSMGSSVGSAAGNSIGTSMFGSSAPHGLIAGAMSDPDATDKPANYRSNYVAPDAPSPDAVDGGSNCRQYPQQFMVKGRVQQYLRTACMQPDGTWKVVQ
jgi:surface antigen